MLLKHDLDALIILGETSIWEHEIRYGEYLTFLRNSTFVILYPIWLTFDPRSYIIK